MAKKKLEEEVIEIDYSSLPIGETPDGEIISYKM